MPSFLVLEAALAIIAGYLVGSISFGNLIVARLSPSARERVRGSGLGASTMYRLLGRRAAAFVLLGDFGKGAIAVSLARWVASPEAAMFTGAGVVIGNNWPIFYGFKGGRGVAATAGSLLPLIPGPIGISLGIAAAAFMVTRNMVITSSVLAFGAAILTWLLPYPVTFLVFGIGLAAAVAAYTVLARLHVPWSERWHASTILDEEREKTA